MTEESQKKRRCLEHELSRTLTAQVTYGCNFDFNNDYLFRKVIGVYGESVFLSFPTDRTVMERDLGDKT